MNEELPDFVHLDKHMVFNIIVNKHIGLSVESWELD